MGRQDEDDLVAIVCAIFRKCGLTVHCHLPLEAILRQFPPWMRGYFRKVLRKAVNKKLVYEKPHGKGRKSYGLTREGVELASLRCKE